MPGVRYDYHRTTISPAIAGMGYFADQTSMITAVIAVMANVMDYVISAMTGRNRSNVKPDALSGWLNDELAMGLRQSVKRYCACKLCREHDQINKIPTASNHY